MSKLTRQRLLFGDPAVRHTLAQGEADIGETVADDYIRIINRVLAKCAGGRSGRRRYPCCGNRGGISTPRADTTRLPNRSTRSTSDFIFEYDLPRAGNFALLDFFLPINLVVLGLVSTKSEKWK